MLYTLTRSYENEFVSRFPASKTVLETASSDISIIDFCPFPPTGSKYIIVVVVVGLILVLQKPTRKGSITNSYNNYRTKF